MTVRIPISADASSVTAAIDRIREAIRRAGQEGREFSKLDLSHPELRQFADDIRRVQEQVERLTRDARGATAATARRVMDSTSGNVFGPGGLFDPHRWQQQRPDDWQRHYTNAGRYVLGGTVFAPPPPQIPLPHAGTAAQQGSGILGGAASSAMGGAASLMRGFIPAMLALAGLQRIGQLAGQGVSQATDEALANDRLIRTLRDLDTGFDGLRERIRDATTGLGLTYEEAQKLAASWTSLTNATSADDAARGVRFSAGFARGYGMDPAAVTAGFGRAAFMGEDPRRFAGILADAITQSGMTGRPQEVMETLLRFQESSARRFAPMNALGLYAGAYSTLSGSGIPGLRGAGAEALLGQVNQAVMAGGAAGDASQFLTWRALSRYGNRDVFQQQYAVSGGMFTGVNGGAAGEGNPTIFEAMAGEIERLYPGGTDAQRYRRYHALGRHFGISPRQAEALMSARGNGGFGALGGSLAAAGLNISDLDPTAIRDAAEIANPGADLARWRTTITGRLPAGDPRRARLEGLEGEDLRRELLRIVGETGRGTNQGSTIQQSMADFSNALTRTGTGLLPILTDMRDVLSTLTGVVSALTNNIGDAYLALIHNDPEAIARLRERVGGPMSGLPHTPGAAGSPASLSDPERSARARQAYDYFRGQGMSHAVASGLVANIDAESGFNPNATHDNNTGFGILGWREDRLPRLGQFIGRDPRTATYEEQLRFMHHELTQGTERGAYARFSGAQGAGEAGSAASRFYVRPWDRVGQAIARGRAADQYGRSFGGQYGPPVPPGFVPGTPAPLSETDARRLELDAAGAGANGVRRPGEQHSMAFQPLRVIVENGRGDMLTDQFLGLNPPTGGGAPMPWGVG